MNLFQKILLFNFMVFSWPVFSQDRIDLLIMNKKYNQALTEIEKEFNKNPSANLMYKKGSVYKLQQEYQKASEAFRLALESEPGSPEMLNELAETLSLIENYIEAAFYYKQALSENPEDLVLAGKLGTTFVNLKDYKSASQVFSFLYEKESTNYFWNKQYAFCLAKTGVNDSLAISLYENLVLSNPCILNPYINLYALYTRCNNDSMSFDVLNRAHSEFSDNPEITQRLANYYYGNKNYDEALEMYKRFLSNADPDFDALKNYGICLYFTGSEREAISVLEKCLEELINDPIVLTYLSLSYKKLSNFELAEEFMRAAIEAATPAYLPKLYHHLGQICRQQRKFKESIELFKEAYSQDTTNFEILFEIASTYEELSFDRTIAKEYYQSYLLKGGEAAQNKEYALKRIEKIPDKIIPKDLSGKK